MADVLYMSIKDYAKHVSASVGTIYDMCRKGKLPAVKIGGWKCWGNRTACYPSNTDPKDAFICIRRMFNWHAQTFIQTYWAKVDKPINKRLIQTIVDSENMRLNGLTGQGVILGGRIEFREDENPTTNLMDGIIKFHTYLTPPAPAREIENVLEYDPAYFETLFG